MGDEFVKGEEDDGRDDNWVGPLDGVVYGVFDGVGSA